MKTWRRILAVILIAAFLVPAAAISEEAPALIEDIPEEISSELSENGVELNADEKPEAHAYELTVDPAGKAPTFDMSVGDIVRIRVSDATVTQWKPAKKNIVSITMGADDAGQYAEVRADAEVKKMKLTADITGNKKKNAAVNLVINNPYTPTDIAFREAMPASVPVGATINLPEMIALTPSYAVTTLTYRATGAAKATKGGLLTATKAGKAKITVTASNNKKAKATFSLNVLANKVQNMSAKPAAGDYAAISGGWTLWPVSVEVDKKGNLACQLYFLNGADDKSKQIENLDLSIAVGTRENVVAQRSFAVVKAAASKGKFKIIKLSLPATANMSGTFLPEAYEAGTLYFDVNQTVVSMAGKKGKYPYIPTRMPQSPAPFTPPQKSFEDKKPSDYPEELVLDYSDDGFAVLENDVICVNGTRSDNAYIVSSSVPLKAGDLLFLSNVNELVKVKSLSQNADGTWTVIPDEDAGIMDFYQYINYSGTFDAVDSLASNGAIESNKVSSNKTWEIKRYEDSYHAGVFSADYAIGASVTFEAKLDKAIFGADYIAADAYVTVDGHANYSLSAKYNLSDTLGEGFAIPVFSGRIPTHVPALCFDIDVKVPVDFSVEGNLTFNNTFKGDFGFHFDPKDGVQKIQEASFVQTLNASAKLSGSAAVEVDLGVSAANMISAHVGAQIGAELTAETTLADIDTSVIPDSIHACDLCFDVKANRFVNLKADLTVKYFRDSKKLLDKTWPVSTEPLYDGYLSVLNSADSVHGGRVVLGEGKCPNYKYHTLVRTLDESGNAVSGLPVRVFNSANALTGSGTSEYSTYLFPGNYRAKADFGSATASKDFTISNAPLTVDVNKNDRSTVAEAIYFDEEGPITMKVGTTRQLKLVIEGGSDPAEVIWDIERDAKNLDDYYTAFVTISKDGLVTALKQGTIKAKATIKREKKSDLEATITLNVVPDGELTSVYDDGYLNALGVINLYRSEAGVPMVEVDNDLNVIASEQMELWRAGEEMTAPKWIRFSWPGYTSDDIWMWANYGISTNKKNKEYVTNPSFTKIGLKNKGGRLVYIFG